MTDPLNDPGVTDASEDILAVYAANDVENLYFWMKLAGSVPGGDFVIYEFALDTKPLQGIPEGGDADYVILFSHHNMVKLSSLQSEGEVSAQGIVIIVGNVYLFKYDPEDNNWTEVDCEGLKAAYAPGDAGGSNVEVGVPLDCIENPQSVNCFFVAQYSRPATDYAPNLDGENPVLVRYLISGGPVGGELQPVNWTNMVAPYAGIGLILVVFISLWPRKSSRIQPSSK